MIFCLEGSKTPRFILGESKLALRIGYQQSIRREFAHPLKPQIPGIFLKLHTATYDLKYYFPEKNGWEGALGINGMYQTNNSDAGTNFVIPSYKIFDVAPFVYAKKNIGKIDLASGARFDVRSFENEKLYFKKNPENGFDKVTNDTSGATQRFNKYKHTFEGFSASFGLTFNITEQFLIKANVARGYRAPNISEISARGVHPGTGYQQLGDENLKPENNLQEDFGIFFDSKHVSMSAEVFYNLIDNYIFNQKLKGMGGGDSLFPESGNYYPVFKFIQTKAQLYGGEAKIDIHPHPLDWLHIENSISFVYSQNLGGKEIIVNDSNKFLPLIPPLHTNSEIIAEFRKTILCFANVFIKAGVQYYAPQNRALLMNNTETKTAEYVLIDAGIGADIKIKKTKTLFTLGIYCTNIADVAYQSNMSRLKYFDNFPKNYTGRSGIYGMGRNVSFKLTIPFGIKN